MATLAASPAFLAPSPHHNGFAAFHQPHYRAPAAVQHNPFGAFAPRHHSGTKSPSAAVSWRHSDSVDRTPIAPRTSSTPKYRRGAPSHSRTPSTSSEASSSSWRERSVSPAVATIELQPPAQQPKPTGKSISISWRLLGLRLKITTSEPKAAVYNIADLLRLSASPLVGISAESQAVVDDLVAHHVWRRGPQSGTPRRRRNRGTSNQRSSSRSSASHSSTSSTIDESERSD
ncbi:hypothetical protein H4582DRAFT_2001336 [Lactarius indigo]|nr:hypothetical protein H4582DRAFT_2001336 [Lactarius indigo]